MGALKRQELHLSGKEYLKKGEYEKARLLFEKALLDYSSHVGLLCDLAALYYLMGQNCT